MGEYFADDKTGAYHSFTIAGDRPSPEEMVKIQAILNADPQAATPPPAPPEEEPGFLSTMGNSIMRTGNEMQAGLDTGMQSFHELVTGDKDAAKMWESAAAAQRRERDTYDVPEGGVVEGDDKLKSLAATVAGSAPGQVLGWGGRAIGAVVGGTVGSVFGPIGTAAGAGIGGFIGGELAYAPQTLNANAERQIAEKGYVSDWGKAYTATAIQGGLETVTDTLGLKAVGALAEGGKILLKPLATKQATKAIKDGVDIGTKKALTIVAKKFGVGASLSMVTGAAEEVAQQSLERWQAELPLLDDEAKKEYIESAIVGGIVESIFGGGAGVYAASKNIRDDKALRAAREDAQAEHARLASDAKAFGPQTEPKRDEPYIEPPPPGQENPVLTGKTPDLDAALDIDEVIPKKEASLPAGLQEKEVKKAEPITEAVKPTRREQYKADLKAIEAAGGRPSDYVAPEKAAVETKPVEAHFGSETDYRNAVNKLADFDTISIDRVKKVMGVKKEQATAIFNEMLRRQDAHPSGTKGQYATVIRPQGKPTPDTSKKARLVRSFVVKPVAPTNKNPFRININGKQVGKKAQGFATREEAMAWIEKKLPDHKKKQATVEEDTSGKKFGVHEVRHERGKDKTEKLVDERLVNSFNTEAEANEALKGYDPALSPESNKLNEQKSGEERQAAVEEDIVAEVGPTLADRMKTAGEKVLGKGRLDVATPSSIAAPVAGAIVEGHSQNVVTEGPDGIKKVVRNLITLASDLYNPKLSADERAKLMGRVLNHELVHALRGLDLLTAKEWNTLFQHAATAKVPGKPYTWLQRAAVRSEGTNPNRLAEESIAEMVRHYVDDPTAFRGAERALLRRIADFIRKMMKLGQRHDAADLMDTIFEGGIADREIGHGGLGPRNADDIAFSLLKPDNFYLQSARFLEGLTTEKAKKNDWIKMLSNPDTGIKRTELDWLAVIPWLQNLPKGEDIHRNDILNYIKASGPRISVTIKSRSTHPEFAAHSVGPPSWETRTQAVGVMGPQNYAEAILTVPPLKDEPQFVGGVHATTLGSNIDQRGGTHGKDKIAIPNVMAFARLRDVWKGAKKFLFIEEIQSDLHQKGSMNGYYSKSYVQKLTALKAEHLAANKRYHDAVTQRQTLRDKVRTYQMLLDSNLTKHNLPPHMEERYRREANVMREQIEALTAESKQADADAQELAGQVQRGETRLTIPNAPFKTNWEDYVIRRLIRHASEHDYAGIVWHGSPESVADTEQYGDLTTFTPDEGKTQYLAGGEAGVSVTPIVNRYMIKFPKIAREIGQPFGIDIEHNKMSAGPMRDEFGKPIATRGGYVPADVEDYALQERWPDLQSLIEDYTKYSDVISNMEWRAPIDNMEAYGIKRLFEKMVQTGRQLRQFDAGDVVNISQASTDHLLQIARTLDERDYYGTKVGEDVGEDDASPFAHDHFLMEFNSEMAESFERGDQPFFSMVAPQVAPQYSATAAAGTRVPPTPPLDRLQELHNKITYDNLSPRIHALFNRIIPGATRRETWRNAADDTIISLQDRMLTVGRLIDRMKKNGGFISNENDVYLRDALYSSQTDAHLQANDRDLFRPITKAVSELSVTQADYNEAKTISPNVSDFLVEYKDNHRLALAELYLYAQHALERNREMRKRNERVQGERPMQYESGSGMGDGEAQAVLDWFGRKPFGASFNSTTNPNSIRSRMRAIISDTNDIRVASGLTPDYRNSTYPDGSPVDVYEDYVPIRGFLGEAIIRDEAVEDFARTGKGFNIRGKEDFSALGRISMGRDLMAHAMMQNQETIVRAGKNKVARSFRQLILDNPAQMADTAEIMRMPKTKWTFDKTTGLVVERRDTSVDTDPSVLKGKLDGQTFYIKIKDKRIAKAMGAKTGMGNDTAIRALLKGLNWVNRGLAATRTSLNPEFMVNNMLKDLQSALINISEYDQKGVRSKIIASVFPALNGVRKGLRKGDRTSEWPKVYDEFQQYGGHTAVFGIRELEDTIKTINKHFQEDFSGPMGKVKQPIQWIGKFVGDYNLAIENGTRLAAYKTLRDKYLELSGDPTDPANQRRAKEMAAFAAKKLTVDFNMGGESKSVMSALYMFFNASMQGSMALLNPFIRSRKMKKIWAGVVVAGAVQDLLMSMLSPEDDDGEKTYDKIPEHILERNMVFMDPFGMSERGYFKIPMPYLMNGIHNWGRLLGKAGRGKATLGEVMSSGGMTMVDSLNPWGGSNSFLNWVAPTLIDPFVDLYQNEDYTGTPIAPPVSPYDNVAENRSQQYWNNTSPIYVTIADWMSRLTGREGDFIPGAAEWSPNQVEYVYDWLTGGTGPFLARAATLAYGGVTGDFPDEYGIADIPFARKGYGSITSKNDLQDYIEGRDQVLRIRKALRDARKEGDNDAYMRIMREYPKEYKAAARVNALENRRKRISQRIKKIRESKRMTDERKEVLINALKEKQNAIVGQGNEVLEAID